MTRLFTALATGLAAAALAGSAWAQGFSLVGVWSHSQQQPNGMPAFVIYMTFYANGQVQEQMMVPAGVVTYVGQYQFNPQTSTLQMRFTNYSPQTVPPTLSLGQVYTVPVQVYNANQISMADASGPMAYVRQP